MVIVHPNEVAGVVDLTNAPSEGSICSFVEGIVRVS